MQHEEMSRLLQQGDFEGLFRTNLGWDNPDQREPVEVAESELRPVQVAVKRGVTAWMVDCPDGLPQRAEQHRVVRALKRLSRDQLVVFTAPDRHRWQWPEQRPSGVGYRLVDHDYPAQAPTGALLQRLAQARFKIDEEPTLTSSSVLNRVRRSFNADKVTKSFYREFQKHHKTFAGAVEGIASEKHQNCYTSVLLNRLMFIYFIQKKGFMVGDQNYLRSRLEMVSDSSGSDEFYACYRRFLLPLFHQGLGSPEPAYEDPDIERMIGEVQYINGGIFEPHELETTYDIRIKDSAFESLFDFFDEWRWHLDERPTAEGNEINPDVLGYIFEQYINFTEAGQKEKGAYYTKPDVTGYMAESTILPAVTDRLVAAGLADPHREALHLAECQPDTPSVPRLDDHHDLTAAALGGPLRTPTGRATGALQGVRGKVWRRLHDQMDSFTDNLLFTRADLEAAHDAMNERPLYESATQRLAKAVRDRSVDDLAALVVDLHNDNRLCVPPTPDGTDNEPTIVCTMGLTGGQ